MNWLHVRTKHKLSYPSQHTLQTIHTAPFENGLEYFQTLNHVCLEPPIIGIYTWLSGNLIHAIKLNKIKGMSCFSPRTNLSNNFIVAYLKFLTTQDSFRKLLSIQPYYKLSLSAKQSIWKKYVMYIVTMIRPSFESGTKHADNSINIFIGFYFQFLNWQKNSAWNKREAKRSDIEKS